MQDPNLTHDSALSAAEAKRLDRNKKLPKLLAEFLDYEYKTQDDILREIEEIMQKEYSGEGINFRDLANILSLILDEYLLRYYDLGLEISNSPRFIVKSVLELAISKSVRPLDLGPTLYMLRGVAPVARKRMLTCLSYIKRSIDSYILKNPASDIDPDRDFLLKISAIIAKIELIPPKEG